MTSKHHDTFLSVIIMYRNCLSVQINEEIANMCNNRVYIFSPHKDNKQSHQLESQVESTPLSPAGYSAQKVFHCLSSFGEHLSH